MRKWLGFGLILFFSVSARAQVMSTDSLRANESEWDSLFQTLPEVLIKGERPIVKAEPGKLSYDVPRIIQDKPVDNVYDALKEIPGVSESGEGFQLAGRGVTVILNGKVSQMTPSQLLALLKSLPAHRVKTAEVMYNAPARYQVRGAVINIILDKELSEDPSLKGEVYGKYNQSHDADWDTRLSLIYARRKLSLDFLYEYNFGRDYSTSLGKARHSQADGSVHEISNWQQSRTDFDFHTFRLGVDYQLGEKQQLSFVYNGKWSPQNSRYAINGWVKSDSYSSDRSQLHNARLDYEAPFGLKTGVEFTFYKSPSEQTLASELPTQQLDYVAHNDQRINKWRGYVSQEHALKNHWNINYGLNYTHTLDNSYQYFRPTGSGTVALPADKTSRNRENVLNFYAGFSKQIDEKWSVDFSLAAERYKSEVWDTWDYYPNLNLTFKPSVSHLFQFNLSSNRSYPSYWAIAAYSGYLNGGYSEVVGNPGLKPSSEYQAQLVYLLHSKYVLAGWFSYTDDYFTQLLYQRQDRLVENYVYQNFDFQQQGGAQLSAPFKIGPIWQLNLSLIGVWQREKNSNFYDIPFDRDIAWVMANMRNTWNLSSKLTFTLNAMIRSKAIQGTYDLPASGNIDLGLRYRFMRDKATLRLFANDILETSGISPYIRYAHQWVDNDYSCYRSVGISFSYSFGKYQEKERKEVDTSRFK